MKLINILSLILIYSNFLNAQTTGTISGKITSGKEVLGFATLSIDLLNINTSSDMDGNYILKSVPPGDHTVIARFIGFEDKVLQVNLRPGQQLQLNFDMTQSSVIVSEIVIIDEQTGLTTQTPYSIATISARNVELKGNPSGVMGLVRLEPGVYGAELGQGIVKPFIRGLGFSRVVTIYQGNKLENHQWGADHGLGLNDLGVKSADIIKGPASILYGSGALGGVILLKDEDDYFKSPKFTGNIGFTFNTNTSGVRPIFSLGRGFSNGMFFGIDGALESHTDYRDGNKRTIGNSRFNTNTLRMHVGVDKANFKNKLSYSQHNQNLGIIEDDEMDDNLSLATTRYDRKIQLPFQRVEDKIISYTQTILSDKFVTAMNISHHINDRNEIEEDFDEIDLGLLQGNTFYGARVSIKPINGIDHTFGIQGSHILTKNKLGAKEILIPNARVLDNGLYYLSGISKGKSYLQAGLRYDYRRTVADASSDHLVDYGFILPGEPITRKLGVNFTGFTGSLGYSYDPNPIHRFKFNFSTGFRAPDLAELFSNGNHPGTNRLEKGNASFGREQSYQLDANWSYTSEYLWFSSSLFANRVDNYIFFAATGESTPDGLEIWSFNQAPALLYGTEISGRYFPFGNQKLQINADYSIVRGRRTDNDGYLTFIPADNLNLRTQYQLGKNDKDQLFIAGRYVANHTRPGLNEENTDGFFLLSAGLSKEVKIGNQRINLGITGTNLLNEVYVDHMSILRAFNVTHAGRNFILNVQYKF